MSVLLKQICILYVLFVNCSKDPQLVKQSIMFDADVGTYGPDFL